MSELLLSVPEEGQEGDLAVPGALVEFDVSLCLVSLK